MIAGNPNTGKTTLFNALTGASARVGNYRASPSNG
ncbi:MAG: 50S ribosome-binding GTPase [Proteobacteria bacterium]|nr:50S ribosome-binding GTPase [Pseudomonadota bacterium]